MIIKIIALLVVLSGIILIYDARMLTKRWFGFGDQNEATSGLKILGFIFSMIGAFAILLS